jgi:hypothetical protein
VALPTDASDLVFEADRRIVAKKIIFITTPPPCHYPTPTSCFLVPSLRG